MPDVVNLFDFLQNQGLPLLFKILLLLLIFVYLLFTLIVIARIKSLNRTINLTASNASGAMKLASYFFFLLTLFLFITALVIV